MTRLVVDCRWVGAHHESAHATAAYVLGEPIYSILVRDNGSGEFCSSPPSNLPFKNERALLDYICKRWREHGGPQDIQWLKHRTVIALAGPSATLHYFGEAAALSSGEADVYKARSLISTLPLNEQQQVAMFDALFVDAQQLILRHSTLIRALATVVYSTFGEMFEPEIRKALQV